MANQNKGKGTGKKGNRSNRDDFDSGKKVSISKPTKIPRKQMILAKIATTNPEQLAKKVDYKSPKAKPVAAIEQVLTGTPAEMAKIIFDGSHLGLIRLNDTTFRIANKAVRDDYIPIISVHESKSNPELAGISGSNVFLFISQLHSKHFGTGLKNTVGIGIQMKMYFFFRNVFSREGLLSAPEPKKVSEQSAVTAVEQLAKADPFTETQKAYAKAQAAAIPMFMDEIPGEYNLFGNILRVGPHPTHKIGSYLQLIRSGGELGKIRQQIIFAFHKLVFSNSETDNLVDVSYKTDTEKALAFLRGKLAKEIAFKRAEKAELDKIKEERKMHSIKKPATINSTEAIPEESQIAVASEAKPMYEIPPGAEVVGGRGIYGRCHGSHSTHQKA